MMSASARVTWKSTGKSPGLDAQSSKGKKWSGTCAMSRSGLSSSALSTAVVLGVTVIAAWQLPPVSRWPLVFGAAFLFLTPFHGERPIHAMSGTELLGSSERQLFGRFALASLMTAVALVLEVRARRDSRREREYFG